MLDRHELLPCPVIEPTTAVALTSEGTQPDFLAAVAGTGLRPALLVTLDIFNHTAIYIEAVKKSRPQKMIKQVYIIPIIGSSVFLRYCQNVVYSFYTVKMTGV